MWTTKNYSFWGLALSALLFFIYLFWSLLSSQSHNSPEYYRADQMYSKGKYSEAFRLYESALARYPAFSTRFQLPRFKMAYSQFRLRRYPEALNAFNKLTKSIPLLEDYARFFAIKSRLAMGDSTKSLEELNQFKRKYPDSPALPFIDSLKYVLYLKKGDPDSARTALLRMIASGVFDRSVLYQRLFSITARSKNNKNIRRLGFKILKLYPTFPETRSVYKTLRKNIDGNLSVSDIGKLFQYLKRSAQYSEAGKLLRDFVKKSGQSELTRWLAIELLYARGNYQKTLRQSRLERGKFKSRKYLKNVDLYIARSYLRLGDVNQSIKAYIRFQKRYPRARISAEVLWKVAWLYEEKEDSRKARGFYTQLLNRYSGSQFAPEARFRIGLSFYRAGDYSAARNLWVNFMGAEPDSSRKSRYQYWIAKTFLQKKDYSTYLNMLEYLGRNPFDGYYNLKAHLLLRDGSTKHSNVDSLLWEMHHRAVSYLPGYLPEYRRFILVREALGRKFARGVLSFRAKAANPEDWQSRFALAELQERLRNYGQAFRTFRSIFDAQFIDRKWNEWVFLFKRLYPLYFDSLVVQNARARNVPPACLWAIMKKESAFEPEIVSYANAYGLMQVIPKTARQISDQLSLPFTSVKDLFRADFNIKLGAFYIADLLRKYEGNLYYALAAYNAGPHRVDRWRKIYMTEDDDLFMENIEFQQTRIYVRTVMRYYWTYNLLLDPQQIPDNILAFPQRLSSQDWYLRSRSAN